MGAHLKHLPGQGRAATAVSHPAAPRSTRCRGFFRLACGSLSLTVMALAQVGCIVAGPPDYKDPKQTPPLLFNADPVVGQIVAKAPGEPLPISVNVRSEDAGDSLIAALYLDYGLSTQQFQKGTDVTLPASTFDDVNRKISFTWTVPNIAAGCRPITLLVTHLQNTSILGPKNADDVALATWWLNVDDQTDAQHPNGTNTLAQCPTLAGGGTP